ncbi:pyridoxal phosphate-dependent transferase [Aspergillus recurvatus]
MAFEQNTNQLPCLAAKAQDKGPPLHPPLPQYSLQRPGKSLDMLPVQHGIMCPLHMMEAHILPHKLPPRTQPPLNPVPSILRNMAQRAGNKDIHALNGSLRLIIHRQALHIRRKILLTFLTNVVQWFETLQKRVHGLGEDRGWACCIGNGSQELIHRVMQVFTDPGDPVLLETPAYPGVIGFLHADGHELMPVYSDAHGLNPASLEQALSTWPPDSPRPKVLYTTPTGSNPTGQSCTESRKAEILRLAKRFNFMILEDDAYYYLNYGDKTCRARSYLALEKEVNGEPGRVVRFDSLSKIVSPGMRLGILTAPVSVVDKVVRITENINLQPSSTTQLLALSSLRHWGHAGFLRHCAEAAGVYCRRRDVLIAAAERHLQGRATWVVPTAGMFVWLELGLPPGEDSFELLRRQAMNNGVLAIPGVAFMPGGEKCHVRVSFSLVSEGDMDEACRRIAELVDGRACASSRGRA